MPEGIRCSFHSSLPRTIVWPALFPPWKRTTASPSSASRSVIFPFPSSPHWAPTMTIPGIAPWSLGPAHRGGHSDSGRAGHQGQLAALVIAIEGQWVAAHLDQAGDDPLAHHLTCIVR